MRSLHLPSLSPLLLLLLVVVCRVAPGSAQCDPPPDGYSCPATGERKLPDPADCSSYFACMDGCATHTKCEKNYLFSMDTSLCSDPAGVICGDRPCEDPVHCTGGGGTNTTTTTTTLQPTTTVADCGHVKNCTGVTNGWYPDPYNCRKYWHCLDDKSVHYLCDKNLQYNAEGVMCDYDDRVCCGDRQICGDCDENCRDDTVGCSNPTPPPNCNGTVYEMDCTTYPDGWYANPANCRKYFHCEGGIAQPFTCESNYLFNDANVWCDYPDRVNCHGRPVCDDCDQNCT